MVCDNRAFIIDGKQYLVLILVVVEDGLRLLQAIAVGEYAVVLILVVVEDGLRQPRHCQNDYRFSPRLNPCCSGRWSATYPKR